MICKSHIFRLWPKIVFTHDLIVFYLKYFSYNYYIYGEGTLFNPKKNLKKTIKNDLKYTKNRTLNFLKEFPKIIGGTSNQRHRKKLYPSMDHLLICRKTNKSSFSRNFYIYLVYYDDNSLQYVWNGWRFRQGISNLVERKSENHGYAYPYTRWLLKRAWRCVNSWTILGWGLVE